jgi:hypothetical protein
VAEMVVTAGLPPSQAVRSAPLGMPCSELQEYNAPRPGLRMSLRLRSPLQSGYVPVPPSRFFFCPACPCGRCSAVRPVGLSFAGERGSRCARAAGRRAPAPPFSVTSELRGAGGGGARVVLAAAWLGKEGAACRQMGNRQLGNRQWAIGNRQYAIGNGQ